MSYRYMESSNERIHVPIHRSLNNSKDTTVQWMNDPISGNEKYRMKINIEGFNQNEVNARVDGSKLFIYGERIENKSQGTSKKIIEKFYDLPPDIDTFRPHVTFPSPITMQVDFPSKHSPIRSIQPSIYALPFKLNTHNDELIHENRRIPIINSRDSLVVPENSIYKFHSDPLTNQNSSTSKQPILRSILARERSGTPILSGITEEDSVRSLTPETDTSSDSSIFPSDFNSEVFYQSLFQPEIFTDDHHQRYIELKLDVHDYNPDDIKVSINDNDLIVQVNKSNFSKQITLPSNIDSTSLSVHHHHDKKLYITIKLLDEYSSFKYI